VPCRHCLAVRQFLGVKGVKLNLERTDFVVAWHKTSAADMFNARRAQTIASADFSYAAPSMTLTRDDRARLMTGEARSVIAVCAADEGLTAELRFALKQLFDKAVDTAGAAEHVTANPPTKRTYTKAKKTAKAAAAEGGEAAAAHAVNPPQVAPKKAGRQKTRRMLSVGEARKPPKKSRHR
jgi:hypothetical protein